MAATRAIGYVRVSTIEQTNGFGLEVQEQAIREYAKAQGWRLLRIDRDEGLSGSNGLDTRDGLATALASLEAHEADRLVVYRFDRLARDLILQETTIQRLRSAGADVVSITEPNQEGDEATRTLVRQVLGAIAQYERAVIRSRMAAGRAAKAKSGGYAGGRPPYGYRAVEGRLVPDEDEQQVIRLARKLRDDGKSLREIATELEHAGFHPKGNRHKGESGGRWHPPTVARVLESR